MTSNLNLLCSSLDTKLSRLLEEHVFFLASRGVEMEAYTEAALEKFLNYPLDIQEQILMGFEKYITATSEILASGVPLENTAQAVWCLLKKHRLIPQSDLISSFDDDDIVEIYLPNHVQWYRSINYFKYTTYSLGELICYPWTELVEHTQSELLHEACEDIFSNRVKASMHLDVGPMISKERFSARRLSAELTLKAFSPVADHHGDNHALVVAWKIRVIDEDRQLEVHPQPEAVLSTLQLVSL